MRVFVAYGSSQVAARVIFALQRIPSVRFVGQSRDASGSLSSIRTSKPDVVLLVAIHLEAQSLRRLLEDVREIRPVPKIFLLTAQSCEQYKKEYRRIGADQVFDTSTEFNAMIELFQHGRVMAEQGISGGEL